MTSPTPTTPEALAACDQARAAFNAAASEPKEGDRVLVQLEATFRGAHAIGGRDLTYVYDDSGRTYALPQVHAVSVIRPAKPAEPTGLGAVVEDAEGFHWVRNEAAGEPPWRSDARGWVHWPDLDAVRVLSEGVKP